MTAEDQAWSLPVEGEMALHFRRVETPGDLEIWIVSSDDYSFVISSESRSGPGLHGAALAKQEYLQYRSCSSVSLHTSNQQPDAYRGCKLATAQCRQKLPRLSGSYRGVLQRGEGQERTGAQPRPGPVLQVCIRPPT